MIDRWREKTGCGRKVAEPKEKARGGERKSSVISRPHKNLRVGRGRD